MAPPRLQFLNASRQVKRNNAGMRAMFSTSQSRKAEKEPPQAPSPTAADLLASLGEDRVSSRPPPARNPFNSFTLPRNNSARKTVSRSAPSAGNSTATASVQRLIANAQRSQILRRDASREPGQLSVSSADELAKHKLGQDLGKQITRRWKAGDVYAPHDLSEVEMAKWKNRGRPLYDVFDVLDLKPAEHYRNFSIMSEYMTPMGRIKRSSETGLRPVNQRRIARAIRRSIGIGMMPSVHRHPELLRKTAERNEQISPFRRGPM